MKSKLIILILLASFLFNACDEFLEEDIYNQITPELLFTSSSNAQLSVNAIYARYFDENSPAREAVGVAALPRGAKVEISCIAVR